MPYQACSTTQTQARIAIHTQDALAMSQKINSKNLSYSQNIPPFLAALQAQAGSAAHEPVSIGQKRSSKKRSASEEAEDAPLVVDEDGNVVNVEVDKEGGVVDKDGGDQGKDDGEAATDKNHSGHECNKRAISNWRAHRQKKGRVVGEEAEQKDAGEEKSTQADKKAGDADAPSKEKKPKKKVKKVKLSFDEDDG